MNITNNEVIEFLRKKDATWSEVLDLILLDTQLRTDKIDETGNYIIDYVMTSIYKNNSNSITAFKILLQNESNYPYIYVNFMILTRYYNKSLILEIMLDSPMSKFIETEANHFIDGLIGQSLSLDVLKLLIKYNLPIDNPNEDGNTPLLLVITANCVGRYELVQCLIDAGADITKVNNDGKDVFDLLLEEYNGDDDDQIKCLRMILAERDRIQRKKIEEETIAKMMTMLSLGRCPDGHIPNEMIAKVIEKI